MWRALPPLTTEDGGPAGVRDAHAPKRGRAARCKYSPFNNDNICESSRRGARMRGVLRALCCPGVEGRWAKPFLRSSTAEAQKDGSGCL